MNYTVAIKEVEDGWYMGQCEQIPGAITQGRTIEEVRENIKEAITLILECDGEYSDHSIHENSITGNRVTIPKHDEIKDTVCNEICKQLDVPKIK